MSGAGLPFFTLSSSPSTMESNRENRPECRSVFSLKELVELLLATAMGTLFLDRWWTNLVTPSRDMR